MPLQIRRGTAAERNEIAAPLAIGELLYTTDEGKLYIGDGTALGAADIAGTPGEGGKGLIVTGFDANDAKDAAAAIFTSGSHSNISFSYNSTAKTISATVDLSSYTGDFNLEGVITTNLKGSVFANDSTLLVDGINGNIPYAVLSGAPTALSSFTNDLGYVTSADILDGSLTIDVKNTGDIVGSVFGDDSSLLVDSITSKVVGDVVNNSVTTSTIINNGDNLTFSIDLSNNDSIFSVTAYRSGESSADLTWGWNSTNYKLNVQGDLTVQGLANFPSGVSGNLTGYLTGDMTGSVFGDDSTLLVDGVNSSLYTSGMHFSVNEIRATGTDTINFLSTQVLINDQIAGGGVQPRLKFEGYRLSGDVEAAVQLGDVIGNISSTGYNGADYVTGAAIAFVVNDSSIDVSSTTIDTDVYIGDSSQLILANGNYLRIDNVGVTSASAFVTGTYTSSPDERPTGVKGMIIFNDTTGKFQGFDGSAWQDLN